MSSRATGLPKLFVLMVFAAVVLFAAGTGYAQETRGAITGVVKDSNNAVVPGASVKITNPATGVTVSVVSNDAGFFQAPYLLPATYQIVVEVKGFKKYVRENVQLTIGRTLELDINLEVGGASESVTVSGGPPALDTNSASLGQEVDAKRIAELPLVHGDPYTLIGLSPGASFGRDPKLDRPFEPTHIVGYTVDGTRANRSDLTIDGVTSTATANANEVTASYVPPTDIIQEFKVQTATFDAQFGNTEGGVTSIGIKSGTNSLHGTLYFWGEPGSLAANDAFGKAIKQARPESFSNRYGGSISGPVWIPKLYNGKNRTFFLWGYEGIKDARPRNNGTPTVPTAAMKQGDFSALLKLGSQYQIYNPFTRRAVSGGRFQEDPFPNNIIPANMINPVAKALLQYFPDPLQAGNADGTSNYQQPNLQERADYSTNTIRIDHVINEKQRIFGRASWYDRNSTYNNYFHNIATGTLFQFISRQGALDDVYTISPTTVLNLRYGYNRFIRVDSYNPDNAGFDLTSVGFPASYNNAIPEDRRKFPRLDITGYQGTGFNTEPRPIDTHSFVATLNKTVGAHSLKGGGEYRIYRENSIITVNDVTGRFIFDSTYTRGPLDNSTTAPGSLGQSFAAFLLGLPSPSSYVRRPADYAEQSTTWGFFIQDDWKATQRLTLNLGLRYEVESPLVERYNRSVRGFDLNYTQPIQAAAQAKYANNPTQEVPAAQFLVRGGLTFPGINGQPDGLYETPKHNFMPRFGLAYKVDEKTVLRAGYGIFFGFLGQRRGDVIQSGFTRDTNLVPTTDGINFIGTLSNPFPNGILDPLGSSQGPQTFIGQAVTFFNPSPLSPYNQRWEIGVQRELPWGFVAEASYVGNRGTHIELTRNLNVTPQKYLSKLATRDTTTISYLTANVPNPFFGVLPSTTTIGASSNISRERLLRPFTAFDTVNSTTNDGYSWYHGLQTRIEKRFSKGYTFQASYTYSKFMQATELLNQDDPKPTEVISDSDYPHRFAASGIWELPFGNGQRFLSKSNGVVSRIVGGWQAQAVYQFQSGAPFGFGNVIYNGDLRNITLPGDQQEVGHWFNPAGFVALRNGSTVIMANGQPVWVDYNDPCKTTYNATSCPGTPLANPTGFNRDSSFQLANNARTFPLRFSWLRYPRQNNWDISVVKNTVIKENFKLQFRAEFINAFNRVWLANPNGTNGIVTNPTSATFGTLSNTSTQANYPRRIQLGLKLIF
ncbi:MAG: TonB-dependent receptor [Acidobacteria bacterium]|nr:TonB-dependent receptor [Acidobacteriota bacterium]